MIVYSKFNNRRKKEWQLITTIESRGESLVVNKQAALPEAEPFLLSLLEKYEILNRPDFPFKLIRPYRSEKGKLSFEYISLESYDGLLQRAMHRGSRDDLIDVLKRYRHLIYSIPQIETIPQDKFFAVFPDIIGAPVTCTKFGCLDLNPDNIFVKDGEHTLIDYEWTFDFPIPTNYIVFRGVTSFYGNHISLRPAALLPLSEAFSLVGIPPEEQLTYMKLEEAFQIFVYGGSPDLIHDTEYLQKKYKHIEDTPPIIPYTQKLLALNAYTVLLEKENNRKNSWIIRLEEAIKEKDVWIKKLEHDTAELTKSTIDLSRLSSSLQYYKSLSPNPPMIDTLELGRLQEYIKNLETEMERKNAWIEQIESMMAGKTAWIEKLEGDIRELRNALRELRSQVELLSPKLLGLERTERPAGDRTPH